jgi:hypothetical protein
MTPVRGELQRAALESVLSSKTFERSEQLKSILRYVCERTWEGHAASLTEYTLGVDVLGKSAGFSPQEDSVVRNRAYALRKKLDEYYESEGAADPIRIALPKGAYAPEFSEPSSQSFAAASPSTRRPWLTGVVGGAACFAAGAALEHLRLERRLRPAPTAAIRAFWGPFLPPSENSILCVASPPQSFLRTLPTRDIKIPGMFLTDRAIEDWVARQRIERQGPYVRQVPTTNSPLWGDAAGASRVSQFLANLGVGSEVVAERLIALPALRNRNVVFLATSEYSSAAARLLRNLPFGIAFDPMSGDHIALRYNAAGEVIERFPVQRQDGQLTEVYGLITRLPGEGDGEKKRIYIVLSGVSSAGILAAAEYATSPHALQQLSGEVAFTDTPLQVLIKTRSDKTIPLSFEYLTHSTGNRG